MPLVPVIVSVRVPVDVLERVVIFKVDVPEPVTEVGVNVAVAREGNPLTLKLTLLLKPLAAVTVTVYEIELGRVTVCEPGDAEIEKLGGFTGVITSCTEVVWLSGPDSPRIAIEYVPGAAPVVVVTFIVALPDVLMEVGLKVALTPDGTALALRATLPENPFSAATLTV